MAGARLVLAPGWELDVVVGIVVGSCVALALGREAGKAVGVLVLAGVMALCGEQENRETERTNKKAVLRKALVFIAAPVKGQSETTRIFNFGQYNSYLLAQEWANRVSSI